MTEQTHAQERDQVREQYARVARGEAGGCSVGCESAGKGSQALGYSEEELAFVGQCCDLGLGCGNPQALGALAPGEVVVDLGCGAGIDCFLAARAVGVSGRVIGVDMTPDMLRRARANAGKLALTQVEFRLGEIEALPIADASADVILSNCVINLSPDKEAVFREAFRVLRPGGRIAISDVIAVAEIPEDLRRRLHAKGGCFTGAVSRNAMEQGLRQAGFDNIQIAEKVESREFISQWLPGFNMEEYVMSAHIEAHKSKEPVQLGISEE